MRWIWARLARIAAGSPAAGAARRVPARRAWRSAAAAASPGQVTREASAAGVSGAAGAVGQVDVRLGAGATGADHAEGLAEAVATAQNVALLGGRIAVGSLRVAVHVDAGPNGVHAG